MKFLTNLRKQKSVSEKFLEKIHRRFQMVLLLAVFYLSFQNQMLGINLQALSGYWGIIMTMFAFSYVVIELLDTKLDNMLARVINFFVISEVLAFGSAMLLLIYIDPVQQMELYKIVVIGSIKLLGYIPMCIFISSLLGVLVSSKFGEDILIKN